MSLHDVVTTAHAWIAAHEQADDEFHGIAAGSDRIGAVGTYDRLLATSRGEHAARNAHLAAVVDMPNDGVPDDVRIATLRTDNERLRRQVRKLRGEIHKVTEN